MKDKKKFVYIFTVLSVIALLAQPAYARGGRDHGHRAHYRLHHPYPPYGRGVVILPNKYITIVLGGSRYHYCDGVFYKRYSHEYVVVAPPVGAVIMTLPSDCRKVVVGGGIYYESAGVYYRRLAQGYEVVAQPKVTVIETAKVSSKVKFPQAADEVFTINIPNSKGGYTSVALSREGEGFLGPQGEFYPDFPKVAQLQEMYGNE